MVAHVYIHTVLKKKQILLHRKHQSASKNTWVILKLVMRCFGRTKERQGGLFRGSLDDTQLANLDYMLGTVHALCKFYKTIPNPM